MHEIWFYLKFLKNIKKIIFLFQVDNHALKYTIIDSGSKVEATVEVKDTSVNDGTWHNATVIVTGKILFNNFYGLLTSEFS